MVNIKHWKSLTYLNILQRSKNISTSRAQSRTLASSPAPGIWTPKPATTTLHLWGRPPPGYHSRDSLLQTCIRSWPLRPDSWGNHWVYCSPSEPWSDLEIRELLFTWSNNMWLHITTTHSSQIPNNDMLTAGFQG